MHIFKPSIKTYHFIPHLKQLPIWKNQIINARLAFRSDPIGANPFPSLDYLIENPETVHGLSYLLSSHHTQRPKPALRTKLDAVARDTGFCGAACDLLDFTFKIIAC